MNNSTILCPQRSQKAWLGITMGLAVMLTVILVLQSQETAAAPAALLIPQTQVNTTQTLPLLTTTLLVGTSADYWPMVYISGTQIVGHDIDLMNAIAAEISATLVYTIVRPPEYLDDVRERELEMRMMEQRLASEERCPFCRTPTREDYLVCPTCGRRLRTVCQSCRRPVDPQWRVCPYCEAEVHSGAGEFETAYR